MKEVQKYKVFTEYVLSVIFLRVFVTQHDLCGENFVLCGVFETKEEAEEYVNAVRIANFVRKNGWYDDEAVKIVIKNHPDLFF